MEKKSREYLTITIAGDLKKKLAKMAAAERRTLSNLTELLLEKAVENSTQKQAS